MWVAMLHVIRASHLDTFDPKLSVQYRFDGTLKRQTKGMQDLTSLSLFRNDVERLLRDLIRGHRKRGAGPHSKGRVPYC